MQDCDARRDDFGIAGIISAALMFASLLVSAVVMSPVAAVVITVVSLVLFAALRPLSNSLRKSATVLSSENIEYAKTTQEAAALAEETEVFGAGAAYRLSLIHISEPTRPY